MSLFDTKAWVNGEGNANARLNDDALNDLEGRIDTGIDETLEATAVLREMEQEGVPADEPRDSIWSFQPVDTALRGPFVKQIGGGEFNGYFHPVLYDGYNYDVTGQAEKAGEGRAARVLEAGYEEATYGSVFEMYCEFVNDDNDVTVRPHFIQFKKDAATGAEAMTEHYLTGAPIQFKHPGDDPSEHTILGEIGLVDAEPSSFVMYPHDDRDTRVSLRAGDGRTSWLALGYDEVENVFMVYPQAPARVTQFVGGVSVLDLWKDPNGSPGSGAISVGGADNAAVATFIVGSSDVAVKGAVVRAKASQTGNLFEAQDSSSNPLSGFTENGYYFTRKNAAPADAELANGEMAIWFDKTNSAAKLMVKAKENGGTVRTGSLALT